MNTYKLSINPTEKQAICWEYLKDKQTEFILFGGGSGGGKTWCACEWLLVNCLAYPGTKWFIARNELKRLMQSTYITWLKMCQFHKVPEFWKLNSNYNYITFWNGSRIDLLDVAYKPSDPLYERFGSTEFTAGFMEEVGEMNERVFDVLKSRIGRQLNNKLGVMAKILLTCNPKKNWVYYRFYQPWRDNKLTKNAVFIQSLYTDNPYTADQYGAMLNQINDKVLKARLMRGEWEYEDDMDSLMNYDKILEMFDKPYEPKPNDEFYLSVDVARFGRNKAVMIFWQGYHIKMIWHYDKSSMTFLEEKIKSKCRQFYIPYHNVVVDSDGVGGGIIDHIPGVYAFVNGAKSIEEFDDETKYRMQLSDRFRFKNLRSQCYSRLANLINEGKISCYKEIEPEIRNYIIQELECIKRKDVMNNEKMFQIIGKDEIKETIGRSPDFSDACMMRMIFDLGKPRMTINGDTDVCVAW